jgi:hypothetical protein
VASPIKLVGRTHNTNGQSICDFDGPEDPIFLTCSVIPQIIDIGIKTTIITYYDNILGNKHPQTNKFQILTHHMGCPAMPQQELEFVALRMQAVPAHLAVPLLGSLCAALSISAQRWSTENMRVSLFVNSHRSHDLSVTENGRSR